jgi:maltose/moltooligosaccharide transporter
MNNEPNTAEGEKVASSVIWSYYIGGAALLLTVLWTALRVKEYPPKEYEEYNNVTEEEKNSNKSFLTILKNTPKTMLQLGVVQFFSWFALFIMWVYTTQGLAENVWNTSDPLSKEYNDAGDWTGVIFGIYSVFAALFSIIMPKLANKFGRKSVYSTSLLIGGISLISIFFIHDKMMLLVPMVGIGIAWGAILAMPYAILSKALPASKMGVYMGIFNATITIPQIVAGLTGGLILQYMVSGDSIKMLIVAGISMILAALSVSQVKEKHQ